MKRKRLSVIIPLYNVEDCVYKAAESIADQPCKETEIVLVDDGSPDASLARCLAGLRGVEMLIVRQENAGLGCARNNGIRAATGEYVLFLDGDDFLLPGAFKNILAVLDAENPDVLFGRHLRWIARTGFTRGKEYHFNPPPDRKKRTEYILGALPERSWNAWRYVCRRDFIVDRGLLFEEGVLHEDMEWTLALLESAGRVSYLAKPFYAYNHRRPGSIMNTRSAKRLMDLNAIVFRLLHLYRDRPVLCRLLVWESLTYMDEYCRLNRGSRARVYESHKAVLSSYSLLGGPGCRLTGILGLSPSLFHVFSIVLFLMKRIRRLLIRIISGAAMRAAR